MFRLLVITLLSFIAIVPFLVLFNRILDVGNDLAGYLSFFFAWIVTPIFLLNIWKVPPDIMVIPVEPDDPIMKPQIEKSRKNLERFYAGLNTGKLEAYVKFPYAFEWGIENIWGLAHQIRDESIMVTVESTPIHDIPEEMYERMSVALKDIQDWMLVGSKGKTQGGYTILAHAKIYQRDYGKVPKKYIKDLERFTDFSWEK